MQHRVEAEGQRPAAEEKGDDQAGPDDHRRVFAHEEERELHRAVFGVVAADQLGLALREVEGQAVGLGEDRGGEDDEGDAAAGSRARCATRLSPSPQSGSRSQPFSLCSLDDRAEVELAEDHQHRDHREAEGDLVGDHLAGRSGRRRGRGTSSSTTSRRGRCRRR